MSFRFKTVIGVALIEAVLLLILVLSSLTQLQNTGEAQLLQRARTTATLFATTTADAVLASDLASLEAFVQEVLKNPGLVYARVRDRNQVLAQDGAAQALSRPFAADTAFDDVTDDVFDATAPIEVAGEVYGQVEIGLDVAQLQHELQRATRTFSGIAVTELVASALFSLVLGSLLTKQLHSLIKGTRAVGEGRYGYQVEVRGTDEIAQAAQAFNGMSAGLAQLMQENAHQRDDLQSTTDLLSGLVDNLPSGVVMVDMDDRVLYANRVFSHMFHVPRVIGDLKGHRYADLAEVMFDNFAYRRAAQLQLEALVRRAEPAANLLFELRDGRFIETDYTPLVAHGEQYAHLWNHRDVTERVMARRQLQERRRQLDTVFELSPDGFVYFDGSGSVSSVNPAFARMTGLDGERVIGIHRNHFFATLRSECGITDIDDSEGHRLIRTTIPKPRVLSCRERSLLDVQGNKTALVMYFRDVTHERELDDMKSDFLATAAHELRTPLTSVLGYSELLLEFEHDEATRREMLETVHRQSSHLVTMLNELLDLARIEARAGKDFDIKRQPLLPLIREVADGYLPESAGRKLVSELPETLPAVPVDGNKLRQVLNNVLSNAFKYSPRGGDVVMRVAADSRYVRIAVSDDGIGMTPDQVASIFERFYRADKSRVVPGSGLGMSLVREIVAIHGWDVEIDSRPGEGTEVTVVIPVAETAGVQIRETGA